ncbi:MAG TPA: thioredoxin family protein [bacterium]|nr:thioredoxin family protein [bacterium]
MLDWQALYAQALPYHDFLQRYGTEAHRARWAAMYGSLALRPAQRALLAGFTRQMHLLCLAATWCGDCVREGTVLQRIAESSPAIGLRFLERDAHPAVAQALAINRGLRIPVVVFLSEEFAECARYGERTLATYRKMAAERLGPSCPTGIVPPEGDYLDTVAAEWLDEIERVQLLLRLSPRLRAIHGD